jgi:threonine aldolase
MRKHDFRSDTVTLPTAEMMDAVARAPLGDAARGDDPTVNALEALAREHTGKEEALFLPSGTMANLAALLAHECRGGEVIVEQSAHIYNSEGGGLSSVAGALARPIAGRDGALDPLDVAAAIRNGQDPAHAPTRLVCIENTHNAAGGTVMPIAHLRALRDVTHAAGLPLHVDGARLFNAAAFLGTSISELCRHADSVWFALCKGLGAPVGAVLAGDRAFMRRARAASKMLGGAMRQAGVIAAPAIVALRDPYPMHRRDHALAQALARAMAAVDASLVDPRVVQTNIVHCVVDRFMDDASEVARRLCTHGVLANAQRKRIRFVTHAQVDEASVDAAARAMAAVLTESPLKEPRR